MFLEYLYSIMAIFIIGFEFPKKKQISNYNKVLVRENFTIYLPVSITKVQLIFTERARKFVKKLYEFEMWAQIFFEKRKSNYLL